MAKDGYSILLLDDDRFLLDMYSKKFTDEGNEVSACLSADEALHAIDDGVVPDAVVFDLVMPERDGFEFLRLLQERNLPKTTALIALTNQGADEERSKVEELGGDEYIVKAATIPSEVFNIIMSVIRRKHEA